jgi:hypothetical protein
MTAEEICGILGLSTPEELAARLAGMREKIARENVPNV